MREGEGEREGERKEGRGRRERGREGEGGKEIEGRREVPSSLDKLRRVLGGKRALHLLLLSWRGEVDIRLHLLLLFSF